MHIALLTRGGNWWLGGSQYIKNIAYALNSLPHERRKLLRVTVVIMPGSDVNNFRDLEGIADRIVNGEEAMKPHTISNRVRWKTKRTLGISNFPRLEEFLRNDKVDFAYPCRPNKSWLPDLRFADWIPDFQYDYYPDGSNPEEIAGRKAEWKYVSENVPCIVLSSESAEKDCVRLFPAAKGKTFVLRFRVWFPTEHLTRMPAPVLSEYNLPTRFFLVSNIFAPTKNHLVIFKALGLLQQEGIFPVVVCTGDLHDYRNPDFSNTVMQSINQSGASDQIRLLGILPRWQQIQLMRQAVAVIQPSLFEGWNTAVEEAHCLGKDLILSDIPVHREQNPPRATYFDATSPEALAQEMRCAWDRLQGGIDVSREKAALRNYQNLVDEFANTFLLLASQEKEEATGFFTHDLKRGSSPQEELPTLEEESQLVT
jgi:glycosyltransferase involved in cell wall biosynthesis